jgi:hypothetical protein
MAIKTREELLQSINECLSDDSSDDALTLLEDVTDTLNDYDTRLSDTTDWKQKYEDNDKEWREKYKSRFTNGTDNLGEGEKDSGKGKDKEDEEEKHYTFDELFKNM